MEALLVLSEATVLAVMIGLVLMLCFASKVRGQTLPFITAEGSFITLAAPSTQVGWTDPTTYAALYEMETTNTTQTLDTSGKSCNLSNINAATWTILGTNQNGRVEHGYNFNAASSQFFWSTNQTFSATTMTYGAWCYKRSTDSLFNGTIIAQWVGGVAAQCSILLYVGQDVANNVMSAVVKQSGAGANVTAPTFSMPLDKWVFITVLADGSKIRMFTNAVEVASGTSYDGTINVPSGNRLQIGALQVPAGTPQYFNYGLIDNAFIVNYPMSYTAITNMYLNTHPTNNIRVR